MDKQCVYDVKRVFGYFFGHNSIRQNFLALDRNGNLIEVGADGLVDLDTNGDMAGTTPAAATTTTAASTTTTTKIEIEATTAATQKFNDALRRMKRCYKEVRLLLDNDGEGGQGKGRNKGGGGGVRRDGVLLSSLTTAKEIHQTLSTSETEQFEALRLELYDAASPFHDYIENGKGYSQSENGKDKPIPLDFDGSDAKQVWLVKFLTKLNPLLVKNNYQTLHINRGSTMRHVSKFVQGVFQLPFGKRNTKGLSIVPLAARVDKYSQSHFETWAEAYDGTVGGQEIENVKANKGWKCPRGAPETEEEGEGECGEVFPTKAKLAIHYWNNHTYEYPFKCGEQIEGKECRARFQDLSKKNACKHPMRDRSK